MLNQMSLMSLSMCKNSLKPLKEKGKDILCVGCRHPYIQEEAKENK